MPFKSLILNSKLQYFISDSSLRSALMGGGTVIRNSGQKNEDQIHRSISANYWAPSNELHIYGKQAGESVTGYAAASFSDSEGSWPSGHKLSNAFSLDNAVSGAITPGYVGEHASIEFMGTAVVFSVLYNDGSVRRIYDISADQRYSNDGIALLTYNSDVVSAPTVTIGTYWTRSSLFKANEVFLYPSPERPRFPWRHSSD